MTEEFNDLKKRQEALTTRVNEAKLWYTALKKKEEEEAAKVEAAGGKPVEEEEEEGLQKLVTASQYCERRAGGPVMDDRGQSHDHDVSIKTLCRQEKKNN